jgi:tetratricopeptide (TPR) repeat protein
VLSVLGLALAWLVLSRSLIAYLAEAAPDLALVLSPSNAAALTAVADRKLNFDDQSEDEKAPLDTTVKDQRVRLPSFARLGQKSLVTGPVALDGARDATGKLTERLPSNASNPAIREEVRALAERALVQEPYDARALRILGQLADAANDEAAAKRLMETAVRHSMRESAAVYWLMHEAFERKDFAETMRYADILLRTRPQFMPQALQVLAKIAESPEAQGELKKVLATNPPWRSKFFHDVLGAITDARTPLELLISVKDTEFPPTRTDLRDYIAVLMRNNYVELAYYAWLQFLPRSQLSRMGLLFNGGFESEPMGMPFDWMIAQGSTVTVDFARRSDTRRRALQLEFGQGRADFRGVVQVVLLGPGSYKLKGEQMGQMTGRRGLEWKVTCLGAQEPLAKTPMALGSISEWEDFETTFTVPETDCRAQEVRLWLDARPGPEQLVNGTMWYDNLQIARLGEADTTPLGTPAQR